MVSEPPPRSVGSLAIKFPLLGHPPYMSMLQMSSPGHEGVCYRVGGNPHLTRVVLGLTTSSKTYYFGLNSKHSSSQDKRTLEIWNSAWEIYKV